MWRIGLLGKLVTMSNKAMIISADRPFYEALAAVIKQLKPPIHAEGPSSVRKAALWQEDALKFQTMHHYWCTLLT